MKSTARGLVPSSNKGFYLVEILVVLAIISVLSVVAIPKIFGTREKAWRAGCDENYVALGPELVNEMDSREGSPDAAKNSIDVVIARHTAAGGGPVAGGIPNPRDKGEDGYVDEEVCGAFVPPPSSSCQVFFCYGGSSDVLVQQFENGTARTYRIVD